MGENEIISCFLRKKAMWAILTEWCWSNLDKILEKNCEGVYFSSEVADCKSTALLKNYALYSYFRKTLLKVWVIANCINAAVSWW